jgi:hypothetical protein
MNGKCAEGKCVCGQGWTGRFCQTLDLLPAKRGAGYHPNNVSSWGGSIIPPSASKLEDYQLIVAEFDLHCGFNAWYEVSRIIRASSPTADGPYTFEEVSVGVYLIVAIQFSASIRKDEVVSITRKQVISRRKCVEEEHHW